MKFGKVAKYKGVYLFSDFIEYFYNERLKAKQKGDDVASLFNKIIMNSLYGKFAQVNRKTIDELHYEYHDWYKMKIDVRGQVCYEVRIGKKAYIISREKEPSFNSFIAISGHITAHARMLLYRLIKQAGFENVYYCDTDSIFCNKEGYQRLSQYIDDKELGKLKLEEIGECIIYGAKNYEFNGYRKIKGIPKKAKEVKPNNYEYWSFESFRGSLLKGKHEGVILEKKTRQLTLEYKKREFIDDHRTKPIELKEF